MSKFLFIEAFLSGLFSAISMPLGVITAIFWSPENRTLAFLMAFGGGALLAALGVDLAGSATENVNVSSETMLPEAYAKGGPVVGISTILGFLSIILICALATH